MIDAKETERLFAEYRRTGDISVRNKLVENHVYIAEILAKKFAGRGVEYDDLLQVAYEALISGVEKFNPDLGVQFTTYVIPTITGMIKNYFRDYSRSVRLPRRIYTLAVKVRAEVNEYFKEHGEKPTVKQLSQKLGASEELIIEALEYRAPVSLDTTVKSEDGEGRLYDVIPDLNNSFERFEDSESLKTEIRKLDPTEQKVVKLRFVEGKSQSEVGKILGVSQMFVSRAERKIVEEFEKRYDRILEKAGKEYEDEPPKSHQPEPPPFCSRPFCQYHPHSARRGSEPRLPSSICSGHTYAPSGYAPHP